MSEVQIFGTKSMELALLREIKDELARRSWWMNLIYGFCLYMTFIYMPFDLFYKPVAGDEEVWFGVVLHGWAAKATEPLHWAIYASLSYGFWKMKRWMWPWAGVYLTQVSISMLVWNVIDERGLGAIWGLVAAGLFFVPTVAIFSAKEKFLN